MSRFMRMMPTVLRPFVVFDDFNRADGALGNACTGQSWQTINGTWGIDSGMARSITPSNSVFSIMFIETVFSDYILSVTTPIVQKSTLNPQKIILRYSDVANMLYIVPHSTVAYRWMIRRIVGGTATNMQDLGVTAYDNDFIRCVVIGSTYKIYINEVLVFNDSIVFDNTTTICALGSGFAGTQFRFDNYSVEAL